MQKDLKRATIVVPCYNEEKRLRPAEFARCIETTDVHFVFVNDGSQDNTRELLSVLATTYPTRISILKYDINRGKAEAVRLGINFAISRQVEFVGFWDADLATPLDELGCFLDVLTKRAELDMVLGSRVKLLGRKIERRAIRHYLGRLFATVASTVLQLPVYDTQCGAKLLRVTPRIQRLFAAPFTSRWVFDVEMIARYIQQVGSAGAAANHIYEFPLHTWTDVAGSKLKAIDFIVALNDLARIYMKHLRGGGSSAGQAVQFVRPVRSRHRSVRDAFRYMRSTLLQFCGRCVGFVPRVSCQNDASPTELSDTSNQNAQRTNGNSFFPGMRSRRT